MHGQPFIFQDDVRTWHRSVAELALACAGSYTADEPARLRELAVLLATAPAGHARGLPALSERAFDGAAAGAGLSVVLGLIEQAEGGYLLSCGGGGQHMASVILPGNAEEVTAGGDSAALAMIGALALALADFGEAHPMPAGLQPAPGARLN